MNKIFLNSLTLLVIGAGINSCGKPDDIIRPNVLFIMTDDHTQQAIHAYGKGLLDTVFFPNIDRLAKEGAIFKQSFVTNSICAPSRAVFLTGRYSHLNGKIENYSPFNWEQPMFPKELQNAGYQTALIGKIHLAGTPQGFDYYNILPGQGEYYNPDFIENGERRRFEGHCTPLITEFTLNWLENIRDKTRPFVLLYHHKTPHRQWLPETKYLDFLEDREFELPDNFFDNYEGRGSAAREQEQEILNHLRWGFDLKFDYDPFTGEPTDHVDRNLSRMIPEQLDAWRAVYDPINEKFLSSSPDEKEVARFKFNRYVRDYLKTVKSVDDGIGDVLEYLEKNNLLDNTVVIYTSDQGFYLGEHGWFDKRFMYEESFSTPLLMRYPREIEPGTVINDLVLNLDLAPTILDFTGTEIPEEMQGQSVREILSGKAADWRDAVYYHYYEYPAVHMVKRHYGVRTDRYKLIHFYYDVDEWEMYDLYEDPQEMTSVYDNPDYFEVRLILHKKLEDLRKQYGDSDELTQQFLDEALSR